MKTACVLLITTAWLAAWIGISLGLAGCLTAAEPEPPPALVAAGR